MQLHQLTYFLAVVDTRNFTRAAELSRITQPSLSKQIRNLEEELGASLFSRARGNITLTPAGEALLPFARRILTDMDTAQREVQQLVGMRRGRIRLGATPSLCAGLLGEALAMFHQDYPGIELHVEESGSRDLVGALANGELDLALIILPLHSSDPALVTTPILRESLVAVSSRDAPPPTERASLRITDLRDQPLVMFRRGYDVRETTLHACRVAGFEPPLAVEGGEMDAVLRFVEAGLGIAVVPSMVLKNRPGLRGTPLSHPRLLRTIALAHRRDVEPVYAAKTFRHALMSYIGRLGSAELGADLEIITPRER